MVIVCYPYVPATTMLHSWIRGLSIPLHIQMCRHAPMFWHFKTHTTRPPHPSFLCCVFCNRQSFPSFVSDNCKFFGANKRNDYLKDLKKEKKGDDKNYKVENIQTHKYEERKERYNGVKYKKMNTETKS